jgi:hypothetical protein
MARARCNPNGRWLVLLGLLGLMSSYGRADEREFSAGHAWLHVNGYTHHFDAPGTNSNLWGTGITWYDQRYGPIVTAWEADAFADSACKLSAYAGRSWIRPTNLGGFGITGALMYHRNFVTQNRWRVLPVGLPFWQSRGNAYQLRVYYIPPVRSRCDQQLALQLMLPLSR